MAVTFRPSGPVHPEAMPDCVRTTRLKEKPSQAPGKGDKDRSHSATAGEEVHLPPNRGRGLAKAWGFGRGVLVTRPPWVC